MTRPVRADYSPDTWIHVDACDGCGQLLTVDDYDEGDLHELDDLTYHPWCCPRDDCRTVYTDRRIERGESMGECDGCMSLLEQCPVVDDETEGVFCSEDCADIARDMKAADRAFFHACEAGGRR